MSKTLLRHTLIKKYFWHFCWFPYLYTFSTVVNSVFQICAAIYQLLLHMVFTSRNWFAMQGPVAIILISWNVIFIGETGYWLLINKTSSIYLYVKWKALASWIFLSFTSFWRNSDSDEYKNKSARRGAQFVPIGNERL
jgi:hypothetical protein